MTIKVFNKIILIITILIISLSLLNSETNNIQQIDEKNNKKLDYSSLNKRTVNTRDEPFFITSDQDLADSADSGSGTIGDPYIIEGWNLDFPDQGAIHIKGTTKHFIIRNCTITTNDSFGLYIEDVAPSTVTIRDNNFIKTQGILLWKAESSTIKNNIINGVWEWPYTLHLSECENSIVSNNIIRDGGLTISESKNTIIIDNIFENSGISLTGLQLEDFTTVKINDNNNTVNGLPIGYFIDLSDEVITGNFGQLLLINCKEIIIKDLNFSRTNYGIALYYCTEVKLDNNNCSNNIEGIRSFNSPSCTYSNNILNNNLEGMTIIESDNCKIERNTINGNNFSGLRIYRSNSLLISNNTANGNRNFGIEIISSIYVDTHKSYLENVTVELNTCKSNFNGIFLNGLNSSKINNNICENNNETGIRIINSGTVIISDNRCNNNGFSGIYIENSLSITLVNNICLGNGETDIIIKTVVNPISGFLIVPLFGAIIIIVLLKKESLN